MGISTTLPDPTPPKPAGRVAHMLAVSAFIEGVAKVGSASSLRAWFTGDLLLFAGASGCEALREGAHVLPIEPAGSATEEARTASAIVEDACAAIALEIAAYRRDPRVPLAQMLIERGCLEFRNGWQAVLAPDRSVSDWVLALLLTATPGDPYAFIDKLCVCETCGTLSFGEPGETRCAAHRRAAPTSAISGVRLREPGRTGKVRAPARTARDLWIERIAANKAR